MTETAYVIVSDQNEILAIYTDLDKGLDVCYTLNERAQEEMVKENPGWGTKFTYSYAAPVKFDVKELPLNPDKSPEPLEWTSYRMK